MLLVLLLCISGTLGAILPVDKAVFDLRDAHEYFETFIQTYNQQYLNEDEKQSRFEIFQQNLIEINRQNSDPDQHATFASIESQYAIMLSKQLEFSEQQLVDCDELSGGCKVGNVLSAFVYLMNSGGVETENDYPYTAHDGSCQDNQGKKEFAVTGYSRVLTTSEHYLMWSMSFFGPFTVALDSSALQHYKSGIITKCPENVDHAVLLVGYGTENDIPYFTMKNSFGEKWGEDGFFRVKRSACGMTKEPALVAFIL